MEVMGKRTIFVSVGHGGKNIFGVQDKGASYLGINEYDFVRPVIDELAKTKHKSFTIVRVPTGSLASKIRYINKNCKDGDIALEFHMDSAVGANGCSTWYMSGSDYAYKSARQFQMAYTKITGIEGRGVHGDLTNRHGRLGFIRDTKPLALLVEMGFLQSTKDRELIDEKGVEGIVEGIFALIR